MLPTQKSTQSHVSRCNPRGGLFHAKVTDALARSRVVVNGENPWDILVHNSRFYREVALRGSLGLGESYMNGWWDCNALDQFFTRVFLSRVPTTFRSLPDYRHVLKSRYCNMQSRRRAGHIGRHHYDIGNDLYQLMLDGRMMYSCGFWKNARSLDEAQTAKLRLALDKLHLEPGMRLLDIGCGWGGTARFAAEQYGARVVGVTVSKEQAAFAAKNCHGLEVEIRLQDYREIQGSFDRIVSIGMFEHVGVRNYRTYMETVHRLLSDDGVFLLHTIGGNRSVQTIDPWINRYIFPNAVLPSAPQITTACEGLFLLDDWHSFGPDYDTTLMAWHDNFEKNRDRIPQAADERFYRMWRYYLLSCAASFRTRNNHVWQLLLSKKGLPQAFQTGRCLRCCGSPTEQPTDS